jgi:4-amino-4-deoxy-L-arabinose transferase-like glycosyltransferase
MKDFFERFGTLLLLIFLVLCKAALILIFIKFGDIGLGPDEAQYWTWSKDLSFGYYSKPPGIAWQIWLGTLYAGDTELGVRLLSVGISCLFPILIYFLAWVCELTPLTCFWAGLTMALTPLGVVGSLFAITDVGMMLFWILACIAIANALNQQKTPPYWLIGLIIGLGALFKWPIYLLWVFILLLFPFAPQLINKRFILGILISLIGLVPTLIWNMQNDFVTFRHVFSTVYVEKQEVALTSSPIMNGNFWDFFGAQAALLSPILFILLIISFWMFIKEIRVINAGLTFCGALCFSLLTVFLTVSIFKKMQGNWVDYAYPSGIVFLAWFCCERVPRAYPWLKGGLVLSVFLCLAVLSYPAFQQALPFNTPYKINPFKHNLGWHQLKHSLDEIGYNPSEDFLFGDKYQTASILSFYNTTQKRAYFLNLHGIRNNQFSYWPGMAEEQVGKNGFFVVIENSPHLDKLDELHTEQIKEQLTPYFTTVEYLGKKPLLIIDEQIVKEAAIFKGIEYNGLEPAKVDLY